MADNLGVPGGTAGPVATDEISGTHHQRVKIQYGTDGSATDVSDTNPLPIDDAGGSITVDNATISVVGSGTQATAQRVTLATDGAVIGAVNETAPGTDTASSGLNGRLQRIAQRLTNLIALLPSSLGQKTAANSLAVVLPSDQTISAGTSFAYLDAPAIGMTGITYDTDDVVGGLLTIGGVTNTKAFRLDSITVRSLNSSVTKDYMIIFFAANPSASTFTNGDTFVIHVNDKAKVTAMLPIADTDFQAFGAGGTYFAAATVSQNAKVLASTGSAYMVVVAKETIVGSADALQLSIGVTQDG